MKFGHNISDISEITEESLETSLWQNFESTYRPGDNVPRT